MSLLDRPAEVRSGEELDERRVGVYLREILPGLEGEARITQFPGGASNLTYLVSAGGEEWILRRPPFGSRVKSAHDMGREFRILSRLHRAFRFAPRPVALCEDEGVIGTPFYLMERLTGVILRRDRPPGMELEPEGARRLCENLLDVHVQLHRVDYEAVGLGDLGKPAGYVRRQVEGWSRRYEKARTDDVPSCDGIMEWLEEKMPPESPRPVIVHNDFKFDNVVLAGDPPHEIIGVLDWEMATLGDPLMDLGCSLAYWVEAGDPPELEKIRMLPTHLGGMLSRGEMLEGYSERTGVDADRFDFYYAFGLFRLAVIVQQIYKRFVEGSTGDRRFAGFGGMTALLGRAAERVIADSEL